MFLEKLTSPVQQRLLFLKRGSGTITVPSIYSDINETLLEIADDLIHSTSFSSIVGYLFNKYSYENPYIAKLLEVSPYIKYGLGTIATIQESVRMTYKRRKRLKSIAQEKVGEYQVTASIVDFLNIYNKYREETSLYHPSHYGVLQIFTQNKHPHVLIHGSPGTGKTSIANFISKKMYATRMDITDLTKIPLFNRTALVVLNDVDKLILDTKHIKLLLDILDHKEIPIIMTTNHPELLDPALVRAGRISHTLEIGYLNREEAIKLIYKSCTICEEKDIALYQLALHNLTLPDEVIELLLESSKEGNVYSPSKLNVFTVTLLNELHHLQLNNFLTLEGQVLTKEFSSDKKAYYSNQERKVKFKGDEDDVEPEEGMIESWKDAIQQFAGHIINIAVTEIEMGKVVPEKPKANIHKGFKRISDPVSLPTDADITD